MSNLSFNNTNAIDWAWKVNANDVSSNNTQIKSALMDLTKASVCCKI